MVTSEPTLYSHTIKAFIFTNSSKLLQTPDRKLSGLPHGPGKHFLCLLGNSPLTWGDGADRAGVSKEVILPLQSKWAHSHTL